MSAATIANQTEIEDRFFLRWSDTLESATREAAVEVVHLHPSELIIRSDFPINVDTKVFLIGKNYTENGIVQSCQKDGDGFLLTVCAISEHLIPDLLAGYDPGVLAVDDFLTEEQEAKILESLK